MEVWMGQAWGGGGGEGLFPCCVTPGFLRIWRVNGNMITCIKAHWDNISILIHIVNGVWLFYNLQLKNVIPYV